MTQSVAPVASGRRGGAALEPPGLRRLLGELRWVREPARLLWQAPRLRRVPRGAGQPVLFLPGFKSPEIAMEPLRAYLGSLGYDTRHWGLGTNHGHVPRLTREVVRVTETVTSETGQGVVLVGWSLGGVLAREAARRRPDLVAGVVTYGTPVVGGPTYTVTARLYSAEQRVSIRSGMATAAQTPISVPITAIWSRRDGIVAPAACIDQSTEGVRHVEVSSTHLGLGLDPDVWRIVARSLSEMSGMAQSKDNGGSR